jgi:hypothetical protein
LEIHNGATRQSASHGHHPPRWISQRAFVHEVNEILSTAAAAQWTRRHPRTDDYQHHRIERLRAGEPKKADR